MKSPSPWGRRACATTALLLTMFVSSCAAESASTREDDLSTDAELFESDGFSVVEISPDDRTDPVDFEGTTEAGDPVSDEDFAGEVYVVNFWYATCGPCIAEAPMLEQVWQETREQNVGFLGVNVYDQAATARAFAAENTVTYPSVIDVNDGGVKLAFAQATPIQATPTTLVMDRQGRVSARVIGQLESASILSALVKSALDEES